MNGKMKTKSSLPVGFLSNLPRSSAGWKPAAPHHIVETSSTKNDFFSTGWCSSLSSLPKWSVEMLRLPSLWNSDTVTTYHDQWQNFSRATFQPQRATTSLAECFVFFCLLLVCFLTADYRVPGSRIKCDCGWPTDLQDLWILPAHSQYSPEAQWYSGCKRTQNSSKVPEKLKTC